MNDYNCDDNKKEHNYNESTFTTVSIKVMHNKPIYKLTALTVHFTAKAVSFRARTVTPLGERLGNA